MRVVLFACLIRWGEILHFLQIKILTSILSRNLAIKVRIKLQTWLFKRINCRTEWKIKHYNLLDSRTKNTVAPKRDDQYFEYIKQKNNSKTEKENKQDRGRKRAYILLNGNKCTNSHALIRPRKRNIIGV